ncbi:uncharacterized protein LOC124446729 [Xenia sp. Carnegie-2017]|uniref:uncharacterized protein LOC124446729 n=1 Tax=Xenia sp. Carnegie-2017 TaxID=2897299 RepID=UPI001F03F179|nr:uncharacterized protein LOC124446729 [Xenia sp. Carnegie-2017]
MEAAKQGHEAVFNAFLDHDVDLGVLSSQGYTARDLAEQCNSHVIVKMIDNHQIKSRYKTDLSCIGNTKQPHQKVNQWLNDHNPDHFYDDILTNKFDVCEDINSRPIMPSCGIPICSPYKHYSVEESLGKSYGDSTIVDSDRTPLGTPVDSMFQQYMSADLFFIVLLIIIPRCRRFKGFRLGEICQNI